MTPSDVSDLDQMQAKEIAVALDWTPNIIHTPLLIAEAKGFFSDAGLKVKLINSKDDEYTLTPARKVLNGEADLAICPSESVIAFAETNESKAQYAGATLQAVYALLDKDASSILCSSRCGINRPKDLDGKIYGSYNARYEDEIVRAMIQNDGGQGHFQIAQDTAKLDLFQTLTSPTSEARGIDATWIFSPWEGLKASMANFGGKEFRMHDYAIPYGYSPLLTRASTGKIQDEDIKRFLDATSKGYVFALAHPEETVQILRSYCPDESSEFLSASLQQIRAYWHTERPGHMELEKWEAFLSFLKQKELLKADLNASDLFVNL